jgi:hypothetical protein
VLFEAEVGTVWPSAVVRLNALRLTATFASQVMDVVVYSFAMGVLLPLDLFTLYKLRWKYFGNSWHLLRCKTPPRVTGVHCAHSLLMTA